MGADPKNRFMNNVGTCCRNVGELRLQIELECMRDNCNLSLDEWAFDLCAMTGLHILY